MEAYYPKAIGDVIENLSKLPGIGKKTAFRLTFHLINSPNEYAFALSNSIMKLKKNITFCKKCFNFAETELCEICSNKSRDLSKVCVVETVVDLYSIEQTGEYKGVYHVLHGAISPVDGILHNHLKISELLKRVNSENIKEIILATNPTSEGNATASYIIKKIEEYSAKKVHISRIATGIPVGAELEYIDKVTISKALENRKPL